MPDLATNVLSYGDNLDILRRYLPETCVDLVYLDQPFQLEPLAGPTRLDMTRTAANVSGTDSRSRGSYAQSSPTMPTRSFLARSTPQHLESWR